MALMIGWGTPAFAAPELSSTVVSPAVPVAEAQVAGDGADLVIVYAGEQHGDIGPCGCDSWPKGGLGGLATWVDAVRASDPQVPVLLLNPGAWASSVTDAGVLTRAAIRDNDWFHRAWYEVRFDAANVSFRDLPSVVPHPGLVSATHRPPNDAVTRYKTFELGDLRVAVTGVSRDGLEYLRPTGTTVQTPVAAVRDLLPELADHDLVVVLAYDVPKEVAAIASLPGVDVVIEAAGYTERWPPLAMGDAVWVRSRDLGAEVGELRLWVDDGKVTRAEDRRATIGPDVPKRPRIERLERLQDTAKASAVTGSVGTQ